MTGIEIGSGWRKLRLCVGPRRWPTCMGENPPRGIPYTSIDASYGGRCIQIRLWNTRRRIPTGGCCAATEMDES